MVPITKHRPLHFYLDNSLVFISARIYGGFSYLISEEMKGYFWKLLEEKALKYDLGLKAWVVLNNHYHLIVEAKKGNVVSKFIKEIHGASARHIKKRLPSLVATYGQVLTREVTPWDKRQKERLKREAGIANFSSRFDRRINSASPAPRGNRRLKSATPDPDGLAQFTSRQEGLAQFIARYKSRFKPEEYRRLKSAITKGRIIDPEILIVLVSKNRPIWYQYIDHTLRNDRDFYIHLNYIHQNPVKHGMIKRMPDYKWSSIHRFIKEKGREWVVDCFREYPIVDFQPTGIAD